MAVDLVISPEQVCVLIVRARQLNVKESVDVEDDASNPTDDGFHVVLQENAGELTRDEVRAMIDSLNEEEAAELVAMCWIGRGDFDAAEFAEAKEQARDRTDVPTAEYLLGMPLLADYLDEGLNALGWSCGEHGVEYRRSYDSLDLSGRGKGPARG
jgi:hypothetical protein